MSWHDLVSIISGIRRCGKSVLLHEIRKKYIDESYFINFDDNRLETFQSQDFEMLYEVFLELYGEKENFFFDEIQLIDGWEQFVRRLHNEGKKIYITGSNSKMLSKELGTHLTGRHIQTELFPFSFSEYLDFYEQQHHEKDRYDKKKAIAIRNYLQQYLKEGGFPEYVRLNSENILRNLYSDILYRDVIVRHNLRNEKVMKELLHFIYSNISKEISYSSLSKMLGVSNPATIKDYVSYFEDSYLLFSINKFDYSLKKQILNPKKIYAIDTGLADSISFRFSEDIGRQLENVVFLSLRRQFQEIYYHKNNKTHKECDFLIKEKERITQAIQVCYSMTEQSTREREIEGLLDAMNSYNLNNGLILTFEENEELLIDGKKIEVLPITDWLLGFGA